MKQLDRLEKVVKAAHAAAEDKSMSMDWWVEIDRALNALDGRNGSSYDV